MSPFDIAAGLLLLLAGTYRFLGGGAGDGEAPTLGDRGFWVTAGMIALALVLFVAGNLLN